MSNESNINSVPGKKGTKDQSQKQEKGNGKGEIYCSEREQIIVEQNRSLVEKIGLEAFLIYAQE